MSEWFDDVATFEAATDLDLTSANAPADAVLAIGGAITGTVRTGSAPGGAPLGDICVSAAGTTGQGFGEVVTGSDGTYRVGGLPSGNYDVHFSDCRPDQSAGSYRGQQAAGVTVTAPATTPGVNAYMGELDNDWPETFIVSGPSGTTDHTTAAFAFASDEPGNFGCALDDPDSGAQCGDVITLTDLAPGQHTLYVTAWDQAGHGDQTPATRTWTVTPTSQASHTTRGTLPTTGGTVDEDPAGVGATGTDPLLAAVTAPSGGEITIVNGPTSGSPPGGYTFLGRQVQINSSVVATAANPLQIVFTIDASLLAGANPASIVVFRNGMPLPDCTAAPTATPDPCVLLRTALAGGDARVTVLTSAASTWNLGSGSPDNTPQDSTAPNPPTLSPDRAPEYAADGGWYLDTVTVTFASAGDPGSGASGVDPASVPPAQTFTTTGTHTVTGSLRDFAGNHSAPGSLLVKVDADAPQVSIACPSSVTQGATASAHWTSVDAGTGLTTPAAGDVALDTVATGAHTASAPAARDAVGHASPATSCNYSVVARSPVPSVATSKVSIVTTRTTVTSKRLVAVKLRCTGAACSGTLRLRATVKLDGRKRTLKLGSKTFSITAGATKTVKIRISKSHLKVLRRVGKVRASASVQLTGRTGTQASATVTIRAPKP